MSGSLPDTVLATATNPTDASAGVKSFDFTGAGLSVMTNDTPPGPPQRSERV